MSNSFRILREGERIKMKNAAADELRVRILDEAAKLFDRKGIKFTMDDLARSLAVSKKTIYTVFEDKRSIMTETIDRFFDDALTEEEAILNDDSLGIPDQLKAPTAKISNLLGGQVSGIISYQNSGGRAFAHCRCSRLRAEADAVALRRHLLKR